MLFEEVSGEEGSSKQPQVQVFMQESKEDFFWDE